MGSDTVDLYSAADLVTPWVLRAAVTLGIPDGLEHGPMSAADLASAASAPTTLVDRLLRFLTAAGFTETDPADQRRAGLTEKGRALTTRADPLLAALLDGHGAAGRIDQAMAALVAVDERSSGYERVHGKAFYQDIAETPGIAEAWNALMGQGITEIAAEILAYTSLGGDEQVVDLGGGAGGFALALAAAYPGLSGQVLELPPTAQAAGAAFEAADASSRWRGLAGSFLEPLPPADIYTLISVLHEWDDQAALTILRRCSEALSSNGSVIICERVTDSGTGDEFLVANLDIMTLVATGGRERSSTEYLELLQQAGLAASKAVIMPSGRYLIQARRA